MSPWLDRIRGPVSAVRRALAAARSRADVPVVSVVVVVRGRSPGLTECLGSIAGSTTSRVDVLVVGEGAAPVAADVVSGATARGHLRVVEPEDPDHWLAEAVRLARGRHLLFVDADHTLCPGALDALLTSASATGATMVVGRSDTTPGDTVAGGSVAGDEVVDKRPDLLLALDLGSRLIETALWRRTAPRVDTWAAASVAVASLVLAAEVVSSVGETVQRSHGRVLARPVREQPAFQADTARQLVSGLHQVGLLLEGRTTNGCREWSIGMLTHVLPGQYRRAIGGGPAYLEALAPAVTRLLERVTGAGIGSVPVEHRMAAGVAALGGWHDLALFLDLLADHPHGLPTRGGRGTRTVLPARLARLLPDLWCEVETVDRVPHLTVDSHFRDEGDHWTVSGAAFHAYTPDHPAPSVRLVGTSSAPSIVAVTSVRDDRWNEWAMRAHEDHAGSGFVCRVDPGRLPVSPDQTWVLEVSWSGATERRTVRAPEPAAATGKAVLRSVTYEPGRLVIVGASVAPPATAALRGRHGDLWVGDVDEGPGPEFGCRLVPVRATTVGTGLQAGRHRLELLDSAGRVLASRWRADLTEHPPELMDSRRRLVPVQDRDTAGVAVRAPLEPDERGAFAQQRLQAGVYAAAATTEPTMVLLESFHGRSTADNPGAIAAELLRRGLGLDLVWVVDDPALPVPPGTRVVHRRTRGWYDALARSHAHVGNAAAPYFFDKAPDQVHVQTWHGTPLKRIGEDRGPGDFGTWRHRRRVNAQAARWDALISPSGYCSEIFRRAFDYDGALWETGYPRNDLLLGSSAPDVRRRVRRELGLGDTDRVVLYAPTWRDFLGERDPKPLFLDAELLTTALPDVVVLVRGHYTASHSAGVYEPHARIHDVTRHPDVSELYLAADALVTDYSSVMFDFVLTDKPIVLLTPDIEQYREVERGFYFDLEERAPGPLTRTTAGVVEALSVTDSHSVRRAEFRASFCPFEDGKSAEHVVDRLLALR